MIDLENWMGKLPENLTTVPIIYLSIPGSHNSFSYSISSSSRVSPDSPPLVRNLGKWIHPVTKRIIFKWSQGQSQDVIKQLYLGIRYFDVRLVMKNDNLFIAHGLYGGLISDFMKEMSFFLDNHPKEVVILDFQHFYEFHYEHHNRMISMLSNTFGKKICKRQQRMRDNTLKGLWNSGKQVLIVYRNQVTRYNDLFWPSGTWETPWPNTVKVRDLIEYLNKGLAARKEGIGFVSQGILTPNNKFVALRPFGSLKNTASTANKKVISWLETKNNGPHGINVVICDFVEKYNFGERVVLLNYKGDNQQNI